MNKSITVKGTKNYILADGSDSSSEVSSQNNNKERMKSFKALSTRRSSFMEYLNNVKGPKDVKMQIATLFQSESWSFRPQIMNCIEDAKDNQRNSKKTAQENPFKRAKQALLEKEKTGSNISISGKSIEQDYAEDTVEEITTFRLLKRGSLNTTTLKSVTIGQF